MTYRPREGDRGTVAVPVCSSRDELNGGPFGCLTTSACHRQASQDWVGEQCRSGPPTGEPPGQAAVMGEQMLSKWFRRRRSTAVLLASLMCTAGLGVVATQRADAADPCTSGNAVACENSKPGYAASEWDVERSRRRRHPGLRHDDERPAAARPSSSRSRPRPAATRSTSTDSATTAASAPASRRHDRPSPTPRSSRPVPTDPATQNYDCGNWAVSTQWTVPSAAVSGVYIAQPRAMGTDDEPHPVRRPRRRQPLRRPVQDVGRDLAGLQHLRRRRLLHRSGRRPVPARYKISYNRPFATRGWHRGP